MSYYFRWIIGVLFILTALEGKSSADPGDVPNCKSAVRDLSIPLDEYLEACMPNYLERLMTADASIVDSGGPVASNAVLMSNVDFTGVPQWTDEQIMAQFTATRDLRYMYDGGVPVPDEERRISWLYPDDGCFARAEQVVGLVDDAGLEKPYKLWAFDLRWSLRLHVDTDNDPDGYVDWNWHVVPLVKNSAGEPVVLDAALSPCEPLPWQDWLALMVDDVNKFDDDSEDFKVAVSDYNAYLPNDDVLDNVPGHAVHRPESLDDEELYYLGAEWYRQVTELSRNADEMFGDNPVWLDICERCWDDSDCDDGIACTVDSCNLSTGVCEYTANNDVYEAETMMYHSTGNAYPDGWNIYSNGYVSFYQTFGDGAQGMTISAAGSPANGIWPHMSVVVNGMVVFAATVASASWNDYDFSFTTIAGTHEVRIYFTNDFYGGTSNDRNLYIDKATVACTMSTPSELINLGPLNTETLFTVDDSQDLVIDQLTFGGWTPATIVLGIGQTDNQIMDGIVVRVDGGAPIALHGDWQEIEIPFYGQPEINLAVYAAPARDLRIQWWAE